MFLFAKERAGRSTFKNQEPPITTLHHLHLFSLAIYLVSRQQVAKQAGVSLMLDTHWVAARQIVREHVCVLDPIWSEYDFRRFRSGAYTGVGVKQEHTYVTVRERMSDNNG